MAEIKSRGNLLKPGLSPFQGTSNGDFIKNSTGGNGLGGIFDPAGVFGGGEDTPFTFEKTPRLNPATAWERYSEAANLAESRGNSGLAARLRRQAAGAQDRGVRQGVDFSGIDIQEFDPNDWQTYSGTGADQAQAGLRREYNMRQRRRIEQIDASGSGQTPDLAALMNAWDIKQAKKREMEAKTGLINEIDPSLKAAQERASEFAGTSMFSAADEQALRSRMAAQVRTAQDSRMAKIGASLGIGNVSQSPAAAALAQQSAEEADQTLVSGLRDMSLQVAQMNREQGRADLDLATRIATARYNVLNGDSKSLIAMRGDVASTIDALYSRDQTMQMMKEGYGQEQTSKGASALQGAASGAGAGAAFGPWGALIGGVVGGAAGYMGGQKGAAAVQGLGSMSRGFASQGASRQGGYAMAYDDGTQPVPGPMAPRGY